MYNYVRLQNGVFDHFNASTDTTSPYSTAIPTVWDLMTIMDANFEGNIDAGNIPFAFQSVTAVKIKRRIKGTFDWLLLYTIPINTIKDLRFIKQDYFNQSEVEYEYAIVPMMATVEGDYIITSVKSKFDGVFICDYETIFKFYAGVGYGNTESIQRVGVYEPIGSKYPIVIANANTDYQTGSVSATLLNPNYETTKEISREGIVKYGKLVDKFLKNKHAKILKDWNSNIWLCLITGNPNISYTNEYGMGIINTSFVWTEQGDANNQKDLYFNGLVGSLE